MKILCTFGAHAWENCRCTRCGKQRSTDHAWSGCKCSTCGQTRNDGHAWEGCKCTLCAKTRDTGHAFEGCRCAKCGARAKTGHTWRDLVCATCGQERFSDDAVSFQNMPMIKNVAIKQAAFDLYKAEKGLSDYSGPAYVAARILGLPDEQARALSANSGAYQIETGSASRFNSTGHWGGVPVIKVAILVRYL